MTEDKTTGPEYLPAPDFSPGSFGCHEALHMAMVLAEMVEERLCQHPAVQMHPQWKARAEEACNLLHRLYQDIGEMHVP